MIDNNFTQFVTNSCCDALQQDKEYKNLQSKLVLAEKTGNMDEQEEFSSRMEVRAEEVCFTAGFNAAMRIILNIRD